MNEFEDGVFNKNCEFLLEGSRANFDFVCRLSKELENEDSEELEDEDSGSRTVFVWGRDFLLISCNEVCGWF